jgi:polysaccharide chain length determinant protein (PEP-CTERM system associated)
MERMVQEFQMFGYGTDKKFSMDDAVFAIRRNIQVVNTSPNTFSIAYSATDAQFAQTFTRRIVETLIQSSNSSRKTRALETDQFLDEQLRQTKLDLAAIEDKIKNFKTVHLGELPEQGTANVNVINGLSTQLSAVENALQSARDQQKLLDFRAQEQKRLGSLSLARNVSVPASKMPSMDEGSKRNPALNKQLSAKQAELAALTSRYTPAHPEVVRLSKEVEELKAQLAASTSENESPEPPATGEKSVGGVVSESPGTATGVDTMQEVEAAEFQVEADTIKSEIAKREKERDSILGQIKAYQAKLNLAPALEQELMALSREHEVLKQQYTSLEGKKFQAQMTANLETNRNSDIYKVIDEANLPEKPSFPTSMHIAMMGLGAGIVLGIGAAFSREFLDTTLGSEDEVAGVLGLPVLVSISEIPKKQPRRSRRLGRLAKSA